MINAYRKSKSTETYLLNKIDLSFDELNKEFDGFIEEEVSIFFNKQQQFTFLKYSKTINCY